MEPRVLLDRLELDVMAVRDERGSIGLPLTDPRPEPSRLREIAGTIRVYTKKPLSEAQLEQLKEETEERCPVANMILASGCKMKVDWIAAVDDD